MDGMGSPLRNWLVGTKMSVVVVAGTSEKGTKGGRKDPGKMGSGPENVGSATEGAAEIPRIRRPASREKRRWLTVPGPARSDI